MPAYKVHHYMVYHLPVFEVEAESHEKAVALTSDAAWELAHSIAGYTGLEFSEMQHGALVDVVGDDEYLETQYYNDDEVMRIEEEHQNGT